MAIWSPTRRPPGGRPRRRSWSHGARLPRAPTRRSTLSSLKLRTQCARALISAHSTCCDDRSTCRLRSLFGARVRAQAPCQSPSAPAASSATRVRRARSVSRNVVVSAFFVPRRRRRSGSPPRRQVLRRIAAPGPGAPHDAMHDMRAVQSPWPSGAFVGPPAAWRLRAACSRCWRSSARALRVGRGSAAPLAAPWPFSAGRHVMPSRRRRLAGGAARPGARGPARTVPGAGRR